MAASLPCSRTAHGPAQKRPPPTPPTVLQIATMSSESRVLGGASPAPAWTGTAYMHAGQALAAVLNSVRTSIESSTPQRGRILLQTRKTKPPTMPIYRNKRVHVISLALQYVPAALTTYAAQGSTLSPDAQMATAPANLLHACMASLFRL